MSAALLSSSFFSVWTVFGAFAPRFSFALKHYFLFLLVRERLRFVLYDPLNTPVLSGKYTAKDFGFQTLAGVFCD